MKGVVAVPNIVEALAKKERPQITAWNRLEGRPHDEFHALRAEVRDALWMLSRQWQLGEFKADDAGSPVLAKLHASSTRLTAYRPRDHAVQAMDATVPLEMTVERRPVPLTPISGHTWGNTGSSSSRTWAVCGGVSRRPFRRRPDRAEDAATCHVRCGSRLPRRRKVARRRSSISISRRTRHHAWMGRRAGCAEAEIDSRAERVMAHARRVLSEPPAREDAWDASRLEYRFACHRPRAASSRACSRRRSTRAAIWTGTASMWMARARASDSRRPCRAAAHFGDDLVVIPGRLTFEGTPNARWWAFEDGKTNFGDVKPTRRISPSCCSSSSGSSTQ
jgi:hypothetical protein